MDAIEWEPSAESRQRARRMIKRKNEAFRLNVQMNKKAQYASTNLKIASAAAVLSWSLVGIQLLR